MKRQQRPKKMILRVTAEWLSLIGGVPQGEVFLFPSKSPSINGLAVKMLTSRDTRLTPLLSGGIGGESRVCHGRLDLQIHLESLKAEISRKILTPEEIRLVNANADAKSTGKPLRRPPRRLP